MINFKKIPFAKVMKGQWSQKLQFSQKWSRIAPRKKVDSLVFANHPTIHCEGVSRGRVRGGGFWH